MLRPGKPGGSASTGVSKGSARRGIPAWRRVISERNSTHPGEVRRAVLYISGLGLYEAYINGKRIGTQVLAQAPTDYDKSVFYNVFDVTETICPGENALGVVLGNGRYVSPRNPGMRHFGFPKMFLQLELEYADGTCRKVVSDDSWRATTAGPIRANNEFDGEEYDARMEMPGWNEPGYADRGVAASRNGGCPRRKTHRADQPDD